MKQGKRMKQGKDIQLGQTLEMGVNILLSEQVHVSPVFVVDGYDEKGVARSGVVQLQTPQGIRREELLVSVIALADQNTTLEPYLWKLDAVFYLEKRVIEMVKHGVQMKQEVITIVCLEVPQQGKLTPDRKDAFSAKVFMPLKNQRGENIGMRMIGYAEDFTIDTTLAQDALFTYVKTYRAYAPQRKTAS